jgi:hypothetical protein
MGVMVSNSETSAHKHRDWTNSMGDVGIHFLSAGAGAYR